MYFNILSDSFFYPYIYNLTLNICIYRIKLLILHTDIFMCNHFN
nr:MAG TPA: hypothetical protein [Caudoviricetes sp.]